MGQEINKYKKILNAIGAFALTWFGERILDNFGAFDKIKLIFVKNQASNFLQFFNRTFPLWQILLISISLFLSYKLISVLTRQTKQKRSKILHEEFIHHVEFIKIEGHNLAMKTEIEFDDNDNVNLIEIYPYCTKHGEPPLKMIQNYNRFTCPFGNCNNEIENTRSNNALERLLHLLESDVQQQWKHLKNIV